MKYKAVIFDLFGTLVCDLIGPKYTDVLVEIATVLSVPVDDFLKMWSETSYERNTGAFKSVEANIIHICKELRVQPKDNNIKIAARLRQDYARSVISKPRFGAVEVLSRLKQSGLKVGLISNCTPDAPTIWPETPFAPLVDVAVFSCSVGLKKPDHQIYKLTVERLEVEAKDCLYVANGYNGELCGACEVAIYPVLITPDIGKEFLCLPPDDEERALAEREGTVISSLEEVLALVR